MKRKYLKGKCDDCGKHLNVTLIQFWSTGMKMVVCASCIKPYRKIINTPAGSSQEALAND